MKPIKVAFKGKEYAFTYYDTMLESQYLFFITTADNETSCLLVENHFFITFDVRQGPAYYFNAIQGHAEEIAFKDAISTAVLQDRFQVQEPFN